MPKVIRQRPITGTTRTEKAPPVTIAAPVTSTVAAAPTAATAPVTRTSPAAPVTRTSPVGGDDGGGDD